MNSINLVGRMTRNIEMKSSGEVKYGLFGLAVKRMGKKDEVDFFNCVAFGKTAELIEKFCAKGRELAVSGSIEFNKKDNVYYHSVKVTSITLIGSKSDNAGGEAEPQQEKPKQQTKAPKAASNDFDDDFPF